MPRKRGRRRARLTNTVTVAARGVVSHAQRLLPELLAEIFLHYLAPVVHSQDVSQLRKLSVVLLLGHICSNWRHVAYTTPKLWTQLSLNVESKETKVDHISFVKAWLSRAHPYPLTVSLRIWTETKSLSRIVDAILPSTSRLQDLELTLPFPHFKALVNIPAGSMPLLENLLLSVMRETYDSEGTIWTTEITVFKAAPRLRSVTFLCLDDGLFGSGMYMPWSQLTKLCIMESDIPSNIFWHAFSRCANLVDCQLCFVDLNGMLDNYKIPLVVSLPHLEKLKVQFSGPGDLWPFFQPLYLPALKDLSISAFSDCDWDHDTFMEFTIRSSLDLERLSLYGLEMDSGELLEFLPHMHSLVELKIGSLGCIDDDLFDALYYHEMDSSDRHLIPRLKTLVFSDSDEIPMFDLEEDEELDGDKIVNTIESWWWTDDAPRAVSRLECVRVELGCEAVEARVRERLMHFREQGLDIRILVSGKEWDDSDMSYHRCHQREKLFSYV